METSKAVKVLKGAALIDGKGKDVLKNPVVVIEGSRIKEIGKEGQIKVPAEAALIEMNDYTLMPGMMDIHIHPAAYNISTFLNYRVSMLEVTPQLQLLYTLLHVQMCFEMGFTTLRCHPWHNPWATNYGIHNTAELVAIRDAIKTGIFAGPRLITGGKAINTNSHLELMVPSAAIRPPGSTADGPYELRKMVRNNLRIGCDFIKTCASGGGGTDKEEPEIRNLTQEELDAVVDEAHAYHKHCSCHCFTPLSQKMAVRAGVDTIEHCVFTDDDAIAAMREGNKILVPTLAHRSDRAIEVRRRQGAPEFVVQKMMRIQPHTKETFQKLYKAGIRMALGTDTTVDPEMATNAYELEIYVNYGMTPLEAIQTATKNAAEAIWLDKDTGTLEEGKFADILAIDGDPLKDIRILQDKQKIKMVMKEGTIFVDRRAGHEKYVISDEKWNWKRI